MIACNARAIATRRRVDPASKTCWKGDNASGAQLGCREDRCVARYRAVHEVVFADANWWKGSGDRRARHDHVDGGAGGETNRRAAKTRSDNMCGDQCIFEVWNGKMPFEQSSQIGRINQIVGTAK